MRKQTFTAICLGFAGLATAPALPAQELEMAPAPAPAATTASVTATPGRGHSMADVEREFGAPTERFAAVGQPPITRWVYPGMVVYFEYSHVVHAVALRR